MMSADWGVPGGELVEAVTLKMPTQQELDEDWRRRGDGDGLAPRLYIKWHGSWPRSTQKRLPVPVGRDDYEKAVAGAHKARATVTKLESRRRIGRFVLRRRRPTFYSPRLGA